MTEKNIDPKLPDEEKDKDQEEFPDEGHEAPWSD